MPSAKIVAFDDLIAWRNAQRCNGRKVVWTNGCFDIRHPGHIASLQAAKSLGDALVVGLNSDHSVRSNKGPTRPVNDQLHRAILLAALECVDRVHIFDELTPTPILAQLKPEIHCKGAEYAPPHGRPVPEAATVEAYGGTIAYLPLVPGLSTTSLIERLRAA